MRCILPSISRPLTPTSRTFPFPTCISPSATSQYPHTGCASPPTRYTTADKSCPSFPCVTAGSSVAVSTNDISQLVSGSAPRSSSSCIVGVSSLLFLLGGFRSRRIGARFILPGKPLRSSVCLTSLICDSWVDFEFLI